MMTQTIWNYCTLNIKSYMYLEVINLLEKLKSGITF